MLNCTKCRFASFNDEKTQFRCKKPFYAMVNPLCFARSMCAALTGILWNTGKMGEQLNDLAKAYNRVADIAGEQVELQKKIMKRLEDDLDDGDGWKKGGG